MTSSGADQPAPAAWKGLDTSQMPVFISYDQVERMIAALLEAVTGWRPDAVVGLARGGVVPAAMAAGMLALPLHFVGHDKTTGAVTWIGPPALGGRILLVDDCCSTGHTLQRARTVLSAEGRECLTLVVVHDPDTIRYQPDLSHPMRALFRLPWERGEATPTGRAAKASGNTIDYRAEAPFVGLGLDAALLTRIQAGLPPVPPNRAVLISGLPLSDHAVISSAVPPPHTGNCPWSAGPSRSPRTGRRSRASRRRRRLAGAAPISSKPTPNRRS